MGQPHAVLVFPLQAALAVFENKDAWGDPGGDLNDLEGEKLAESPSLLTPTARRSSRATAMRGLPFPTPRTRADGCPLPLSSPGLTSTKV